MPLFVIEISMNANADTREITDPSGQLIAAVVHSVVEVVEPCSERCLWPDYLKKKVELIPLGGTRRMVPGVRVGSTLLVTNVFTVSRREGWPVHRSFRIYEEIVTRLKDRPIPGILKIWAICRCSTALEFLENYALLDNTSSYTPSQHKAHAWADTHTAAEFTLVLGKIKQSVEALHQLGIIHTDVTGFNILIDRHNNPVIIDLFSCVTLEALGPNWFPISWKRWIGQKIEVAQITRYLLAPARARWSSQFTW